MPFQRSRGGCHNCKKRKKKCDETRPNCRACRNKGLACAGYDIQLRWSSPNALHRVEPVVNNECQADRESPSGGRGLIQSRSSPEHAHEAEGGPSEEERQAFERFLGSGIHALYATTVHEWIKPLMAENSQHSYALLVVCANIQILLEDGGSLKFHQHFERALKIFQIELFASNGVIKGSTLGAGLLLCTLSLLQGIQWTTHLLCMADLYDLHGDLHNLDTNTDMYTHHCLEVMGVMDLPNLVLGRKTSCLGFWRRLRNIRGLWAHSGVDGIEPVSGIPRTLLDICARIGEPGSEMDFWLWHGEMGEFMQCHLWEAWRFAGMLDRRRRWNRTSRRITEPPTGVTLPSSAQLMFRLLSSLEALRLGLEQQENSHMLIANATFYPWFVASTEFGILNDHPTWKAAIDRFQDSFLSFDSSENTRILINEITEAQRRGDASFDADATMRQRGVEIALF